ncbi:multiple sugar transport system permease protein [Paenibacillus algorifonticola]|uniref:Multiple sugar transport system permease protein n=1 Tax=Paenibacillus algorifonticola TaxID=684063 RepID=A0A1I2ICS7_9BACL|nr:carbohydrate ABC transporter permease [Paenibacillus algorifonticola]SFF39458.1 multiple sugar transport system permease protein [Paenibacillus algorifonticola]
MAETLRKTVWLKHLAIMLIAFVMLYPVLWMVGSSFKPNNVIFTEIGIWPQQWEWSNYLAGWSGIQGNPFSRFLSNSMIVSIGAVLGNVLSCSMAAYAFARLSFRFKAAAFGLMLLTIMLPHHVTLIPQYILFNQLGWVNSFLPLIAPKWLATDGFFIFLTVQFIRGLPKELDEAATIDGCGLIQIYWRIVLPLAVPALITTTIFTFLWTWDDFFSQLIYLSDVTKFTVPLGLRLFLDSSSQSDWGPMFAMSVLSLLPCFIIFILCQKYFVEGIATSGIKG